MLLPVLAGPLGQELEHLTVDGEVLRYHDLEFPLRAGTAGLPLPRLLEEQHYRLGWWRLARTELNYRRFFTVPELIGVRVEHPEVFDDTHAKVLELLRDGVLDGLRIDHPDGLAAPAAYLERLNEEPPADAGRWWRRSSPATSTSRRSGRSRAPPGTTPCAGSTGCSPTRPARRNCSPATGSSRARPATGAATGARRCAGPRTGW